MPRSPAAKRRSSRDWPSNASAASTLDPNQYRALADFRYALRQFLAFSEVATRESGVTAQQYQALLVIKAHPQQAVLVRELAEQMLLKHNGAVQLADRLVQAKLIRRDPSKLDRRAVVLRLTAKGEAKIAYLAAIHFRELLKRQSELTDISRLVGKLKCA